MKKIILRGLIGFPIGVTIGYAISILTSLAYAGGHYSPVVPGMTEQFGSEIAAVAVQFVLCGLMGGAFAAMSAIWENDRLSLAAQSAINFALSAVVLLPIAYICHWMEHSVRGALIYLGVFAGIYASIWAVMYSVYRARIKKINADLNK
jgi:Protein of unknown function (DUF3021).